MGLSVPRLAILAIRRCPAAAAGRPYDSRTVQTLGSRSPVVQAAAPVELRKVHLWRTPWGTTGAIPIAVSHHIAHSRRRALTWFGSGGQGLNHTNKIMECEYAERDAPVGDERDVPALSAHRDQQVGEGALGGHHA